MLSLLWMLHADISLKTIIEAGDEQTAHRLMAEVSARMTKFAYTINMAVARQLNLLPPAKILETAETVN